MTASPYESSYDSIPDFGLLYDSVPAYAARGDVAFYVDEAKRAGGPVLELGCGTGRILLPIARAGCTVTGLDGSDQMLERCSAKILAEPEAVQARIALQKVDVREFDLDQKFSLVIAPFRVLQHLTTLEDQLSCLDAVARHLEPNGKFVFDVFNPFFAKLVTADGAEHDDTPEQTLPDGRCLRRTYRVARVRWLDQVSESELIYYVTPANEKAAHRYVQAFDMRWYLRDELQHLLARTGFRTTEVHGDFDGTPLAEYSPEQVVRAERIA